jgi:F-type H+-transporting ATPase subunit epsilon
MALTLELVTPEESQFEGEADFIRAETVDGEIGILPGHVPLLGQLVACKVKVRATGGVESEIEIPGGFMVVKDDRVIILTTPSEIEEAPAPA